MREIKFRFYIKEHKYFVFPESYGYMSFGVHLDGKIVQFGLGKSYEPFTDAGDKIVPQQFTGLKDKNGKEIYEGDIVLGEYESCLTGEIIKNKEVVCFESGCFIVKYFTLYLNKSNGGAVINDTRKIEVIGNVFENPELLKIDVADE